MKPEDFKGKEPRLIIENYLSKSTDHADLEYRMRQLDNNTFNGRNHSFLYRHLY